MGEIGGALAGIGMLALIGLLLFRFLREMGWMRRETGRRLMRVTAMTLGVGAAYGLLGALIHQVLFGSLASAARVEEVFCGPYTRAMFDLTARPALAGPVSFLFALCGNALGWLLFGQYRLAALVTAFLLTDAGACLLCARLGGWWGERDAERSVFLLLCLPGAVFLFLPGWAPVLFGAACLAVLLLGRLLWPNGPRRAPAAFFSSAAYDAALCLCALFSALVTACAAQGWIG